MTQKRTESRMLHLGSDEQRIREINLQIKIRRRVNHSVIRADQLHQVRGSLYFIV